MGFLSLLEVSSMPILQVLIISILGALMATNYWDILPNNARKSLNKIVFAVFTPSLMFANLSKTVTFQDIISWWFMPINIGLTFLFGGFFGWLLVKILKPQPYLEGLVIGMSSAGNLGNLLMIIFHTICHANGSPFGDKNVCSAMGLSYASFSMALGGFFIWTYTFHLIKSSAVKYKEFKESKAASTEHIDDNVEAPLLEREDQNRANIVFVTSRSFKEDRAKPVIVSSNEEKGNVWDRIKSIAFQIADELLAPPTIGAILGLTFGAIPWLKNLIIGDSAPFRVIQDSIVLLGDGAIPSITLILGGNLIQGIRSSKLEKRVIVGVIFIRFLILPAIGIGIVKAADYLGFLPSEPLFHYVLLVQFTLPPANNIGTMTQLVDVGQAECSVLFLWTYVVASLALTVWSTVYMWMLT